MTGRSAPANAALLATRLRDLSDLLAAVSDLVDERRPPAPTAAELLAEVAGEIGIIGLRLPAGTDVGAAARPGGAQ
jgi:hypothetical protein